MEKERLTQAAVSQGYARADIEKTLDDGIPSRKDQGSFGTGLMYRVFNDSTGFVVRLLIHDLRVTQMEHSTLFNGPDILDSIHVPRFIYRVL